MTKKGFTMVELTLSMAFIGVLLVTISAITLNIITIYQKGLAIRAVNNTGRELIDEFSRSIAAAPTENITDLCLIHYNYGSQAYQDCDADHGQKFIYQESHYNGNINVSQDYSLSGVDTTVQKPPTHGAFCTGQYSYIWNTGYVLNPDYGLSQYNAKIRYRTSDGNIVTTEKISYNSGNFRLIKLTDTNRFVCSINVPEDYKSDLLNEDNDIYDFSDFNVTWDAATDERTFSLNSIFEELLDNSEDNLALYDMQVFPPTQHHITFHSFYSGTFVLATLQGRVNITSSGDYCTEAPDGLNTDFAYCAINKFNFATRATGEFYDTNQRNY